MLADRARRDAEFVSGPLQRATAADRIDGTQAVQMNAGEGLIQFFYISVEQNSIVKRVFIAEFVGMLQFFDMFRPRCSAQDGTVVAACDRWKWRHDPLAHPAVATMTMRELADLPSADLHPTQRR